jgi:cytochrome c oxidase subunit 2
MRLFALVIALLLGTTAVADGGSVLFQSCVACHGARGEGNSAVNAPNIAGLDATYLARQLKHFRSGVRAGNDAPAKAMSAAVSVLKTDADIETLAQYLAKLPAVAAKATLTGDLKNGRNYYNGICSACHGSNGAGNASLQAPRLAGIDITYLQRQYRAYKSGARGNHADDKYGKQMRMMIKGLPDEKTENDVLAYIATLKP